MYPLKPVNIYVLDRVKRNPACLARLNRILKALDRPLDDVEVITEQNLPDVAREIGELWPPEETPAGVPVQYTRSLVFTTLDLGQEKPDLAPILARCPQGTPEDRLKRILGLFRSVNDAHPHQEDCGKSVVCWNAFEFGSMTGCPHGCQYCREGKTGNHIAVALNLEEYMEEVVGPTVERRPAQKCFRMIGWGADHITFEPEYGFFELVTRKLSEYPERYAYFHTASANVDWIAGLPCKDRIIGVWSVASEDVARLLEPGSPPPVERLEAARRLQEMGLPVRLKFKPIVPIGNWRDGYARIIEEVFTRCRPESIGLALVMWISIDTLGEWVDLDLLDPGYVEAARKAADELKGVPTGPFPHSVRAEIYRFFIKEVRRWDKEVPIYVSTESREMWEELAEALGQNPRAFVCGCGPLAVPGRRLALSPAYKHSTHEPAPV